MGGDGYRELLSPGSGEADIDTCVPSTTLVAMMLRWMLVFEERDSDTVWLLKAAPRRFYPGGRAGADKSNPQTASDFVSVRRAPTRFGWLSFSVGLPTNSQRETETETETETERSVPSTGGSTLRIQANVSLTLHGRGFVGSQGYLRVALRLRDPTGERSLRSAAIVGGSDDGVAVTEVDGSGESVAVQVPRRSADGGHTRTVSFAVVGRFE